MTRDKNPHITISDQDPGLPYSKGLTASQVMVSGLPAFRAYEVAEAIETRLIDEGRFTITSDEPTGLISTADPSRATRVNRAMTAGVLSNAPTGTRGFSAFASWRVSVVPGLSAPYHSHTAIHRNPAIALK